MKMKPCNNGHYYDQDSHNTCPYCSNSNSILNDIKDSGETKQILNTKAEELKTEIYGYKKGNSSNNEGKTQMLFNRKALNAQDKSVEDEKPILIAGWIVITSKIDRGKSFVITYGMNSIGRNSEENHINIGDKHSSVSRKKHSSILYDFENNQFFIQHHDGKFLTYLNKKLVGGLTELNAYDKIKIGKTEFVFVPLCGDRFQWEDEEDDVS